MWCVCACVLHLDVCMCVFLCLHLVCEFTAEWRHTAACYSKGRGPQGKSTPTGQDLESLRRQVCISAGLSQASASRREEKGFGEKEESTWERQGGRIMQGTCHAHQRADMHGEQEVGTCQVSTWREAPKTGRRGSRCFQQSLSPCTDNAPESK